MGPTPGPASQDGRGLARPGKVTGAPSTCEACERVCGPEKGRPAPLLSLRSETDVKAPQADGSEAICSAFIHSQQYTEHPLNVMH